MQIHVVKQGETLWQIANGYGVSVSQVVLLNQLDDPNVLVVGQTIVVPDPDREYVVQPNDTLVSIAQAYRVRMEDIIAANNITNPNVIRVGELLKMPYRFHTVLPGQTLWLISQKYRVPIEVISQANNIADPSLIYQGQSLLIPFQKNPQTEVNAYTTQVNEQGRQEVSALGRNFTYLSPFMYSMKPDGTLTSMQEGNLLEAARAQNIMPLLVLTNFSDDGFDSDLAATILRSPELQEKLITNILNKIREKGYRGLNIDFEYVYPEDRENYNNFLRRVVARLRPEGYTVSTALAPKESAEQEGLLYEAHDYAAHGEIVDFVVLMTYEWGWAGGRPWAIAPINKVRDILDYAVQVIPRDKILMGMPLYGRDWNIPWVEGTIARTISPKEAVQLAEKYGVAIEYDSTYQSPFFRYVDESGQQHEVWFEDARSVQVKYELIKQYGLRGASYWVLGNPFPQNWPVLQHNFHVKKQR
ncbi:glycoside hydrolase family 18 protein [Virgibacillus sp. W0181]|uniref:glycoside hydrolase family 18 protein n=1 Tax=Virgibacillus sp. W0181 TaxID=3391581 RepID=UPI003F485E1F